MTAIVPADQIERIVGARRHPDQHLGRAVSAEQTVYILHPSECRDSGIDLRECHYSWCLDNGIDPAWWNGHEDKPVVLAPYHDRLIPTEPEWLAEMVTSPEPIGGGDRA